MSLYFQIIIQNLYKSFDYKTRTSRFEFFVFLLFLGLVEILLLLLHKHVLSFNFTPILFSSSPFEDYNAPFYNFFQDISLIWTLITIPALISITARRFHDTNTSARFVLGTTILLWSFFIWLLNNYEINEIFYPIPFLITIMILGRIFKKSDESENKFGAKSTNSSNSLKPLLLYVIYFVFYLNWSPQFIYEIDTNEEVVLNPYLHEIKSKSFMDYIGFGNCTHELLDGTCFIEGDYEIENEAKLTNPKDYSDGNYTPIQSDLKIRHVTRRLSVISNNSYCSLDHIEIDSAVDENLLIIVKEMLNKIFYDINRCKSPDNKPIAIDVYITSPGGYVSYGTLLAIEIKKYGATTHITPNQTCASMCTDLFLAGKERIMHPGSLLAFHSAYSQNNEGAYTCYKGLTDRVHYYLSKKLADLVVSDFLNVCNPGDLKSLNPGAARTLGFATRS